MPMKGRIYKKVILKSSLWSGLGEQGRGRRGPGVRVFTLPFYMVLKTLNLIVSIQPLNQNAIKENARQRRPSFVHNPRNGRDLTVTSSKLIILRTSKRRPQR